MKANKLKAFKKQKNLLQNNKMRNIEFKKKKKIKLYKDIKKIKTNLIFESNIRELN